MGEKNEITIGNFGDQLTQETGIRPEDTAGAGASQAATELTTDAAFKYGISNLFNSTQVDTAPSKDQKTRINVLVKPYSDEELQESEQSLTDLEIRFSEDLVVLNKKPKQHLLSALVFASHVGIGGDELLENIKVGTRQEMSDHPYIIQNGIDYKTIAYIAEAEIVKSLATMKNIEFPQNLAPADGRKDLMAQLAQALDGREREELARYIAGTRSEFQLSPFYSPVSFDLSNDNDIARQNIAMAISPQAFGLADIRNLLTQDGVQIEKFLLALANPHLRNAMPLAATIAADYRVKFGTSPDDKRLLLMREVLQLQIDASYTREMPGQENRGLLGLEELAALIVVNNLDDIAPESIYTVLSQNMEQILGSQDAVATIEKIYPDISLIFGHDFRDFTESVAVLKAAIESPDTIPSGTFWYSVNSVPFAYSSFMTKVRKQIEQTLYKEIGGTHLERWLETVGEMRVAEGQVRERNPLTIQLINDHEVRVRGVDLEFGLVNHDGIWLPRNSWDPKTGKSAFDIAGMSYAEQGQLFAESPFKYEVEEGYLSEILRGSVNRLAEGVYEKLETQVNLEALYGIGLTPGHAAVAYRREDDPLNLNYLIGSLNPNGVGVYDSIFTGLIRHLGQHDQLNPTEMDIEVPLTGETVKARHPLLELPNLTFEEIQRRLKMTETDVRIPEVTIRKSGGYELRAKAWVYEALEQLRDQGFDGILGKRMAEEFNRQAVRIYVEQALESLQILPGEFDKEAPLGRLKEQQQKIYARALDEGFAGEKYPHVNLLPSLAKPLTWRKEQELLEYLEGKIEPEELRNFFTDTGISDSNTYRNIRKAAELFLDFASGQGWDQYDRSDKFPVVIYGKRKSYDDVKGGDSRLMTMRSGDYAVSTQAQETFRAAKKTWDEFLVELKSHSALLNATDQLVDDFLSLGHDLVAEIDQMSQAQVTDWAEKIIRGEMAAVGRDIQSPIVVKTMEDFHEAVSRLMDTARLVLIYRSEKGRFGWEVSTDREFLV